MERTGGGEGPETQVMYFTETGVARESVKGMLAVIRECLGWVDSIESEAHFKVDLVEGEEHRWVVLLRSGKRANRGQQDDQSDFAQITWHLTVDGLGMAGA